MYFYPARNNTNNSISYEECACTSPKQVRMRRAFVSNSLVLGRPASVVSYDCPTHPMLNLTHSASIKNARSSCRWCCSTSSECPRPAVTNFTSTLFSDYDFLVEGPLLSFLAQPLRASLSALTRILANELTVHQHEYRLSRIRDQESRPALRCHNHLQHDPPLVHQDGGAAKGCPRPITLLETYAIIL